jgi:hypothetical protein
MAKGRKQRMTSGRAIGGTGHANFSTSRNPNPYTDASFSRMKQLARDNLAPRPRGIRAWRADVGEIIENPLRKEEWNCRHEDIVVPKI